MKIFDPDGPFMSALNTLADLVFCNILFCLFSLPLITTGAALCALYDCVFSILDQREESFIALQFWKAFRRNLKSGLILYLIILIFILILWAYAQAVNTLSGDLKNIYQVTFLIILFLFLSGAQYIFPLQARNSRKNLDLDLNLKNKNTGDILYILKTSWILSAVALPQTLCCLAIDILAVYISFFMNPAALNTAVFLWAFAGFGVTAYLNGFFFRAAFRRLK